MGSLFLKILAMCDESKSVSVLIISCMHTRLLLRSSPGCYGRLAAWPQWPQLEAKGWRAPGGGVPALAWQPPHGLQVDAPSSGPLHGLRIRLAAVKMACAL